MGLDMYMEIGKRIPGKTFEEIQEIEDEIYYGDNKELLEEYKDYIEEIKYEYFKNTFYALSKEVAYWRKANAIHNWFVNNIQNGNDDCGTYEVKKEQLEKLLDTCKKVLKNSVLIEGMIVNGYTVERDEKGKLIEKENLVKGEKIYDSTIAKELLPTIEGFFFGSTNYDQWYIEKLKETVEQVERILKDTDFDKYYITYTGSW